MDAITIVQLASAILGSSTITALLTHNLGRRKTQAETVELSVKTALALEQRAHERYAATAEALEEAEKLLKLARTRINNQEQDIMCYKTLLEDNRIKNPCPKEASDDSTE